MPVGRSNLLKNPLGPLPAAISVQVSDWSGGRCTGKEGVRPSLLFLWRSRTIWCQIRRTALPFLNFATLFWASWLPVDNVVFTKASLYHREEMTKATLLARHVLHRSMARNVDDVCVESGGTVFEWCYSYCWAFSPEVVRYYAEKFGRWLLFQHLLIHSKYPEGFLSRVVWEPLRTSSLSKRIQLHSNATIHCSWLAVCHKRMETMPNFDTKVKLRQERLGAGSYFGRGGSFGCLIDIQFSGIFQYSSTWFPIKLSLTKIATYQFTAR